MILSALSMLILAGPERPLYRPTPAQIATSYARADRIGAEWTTKAFRLRLDANWLDGGKSFWYRRDESDGTIQFIRCESATGVRTPLFDHERLAKALSSETGMQVEADRLPFRSVTFVPPKMGFAIGGNQWSMNLESYALEKTTVDPPRPERNPPWVQNLWTPNRAPTASASGDWTARIDGTNIKITPKGSVEADLTTDGSDSAYYARLAWTPDSKRLIASKVRPGDRKKVYLIQTSPVRWGPATFRERVYDRPGDVVDTFELVLLDPSGKNPMKVLDRIEYGNLPQLRPSRDGGFTYEKMDRGYGRFRIQKYDPLTESSLTIFDDDPETFVDSTSQITEYLRESDEAIVSSERDGWLHLYLLDGRGSSTQITKGRWVVRSVVKVDEQSRQITFTASGRNAGEDPYFIHYFRIRFDGSGLVELTPSKGHHSVQFSPDGAYYVDTYSTVAMPPKHELRRADTGALVAQLETADISPLLKSGWKEPQAFVAKGRDGETDIYGLVFRPTNFDPKKRYPIVEDIYAGPQDSFVPKAFSPNYSQQRLAELGFIVVKIDGMGTRNRSKAFHDVCYKNLADAGFPDRILWMKSLAKIEPSADLDRVGIFGTSAGGQNAGGAVLFHPDFYKVAVASCGCHDNRLDKIWWNEQWMGVMGPHYTANSNIENASKLTGRLLLIVGELDTNVPPESTYRFAAALQSAGKEYEMVVIPNADHTSGGPYGERKRRDFLVRHLLGVEPPNPNERAVVKRN